MKTVCIDARFYGIAHTGIGRYTENLISNLPSDPQISVCLIVSPDIYNLPRISKFQRYIARHHPYSFSAQWEMLKLYWQIKPDLFHGTHSSIPVFWPGKMIVTFHDLIKHISKGKSTTTRQSAVYWFKYLGYLIIDRLALLRAVKIIVPSLYWQAELVKRFHIPTDKIIVTYEGVGKSIRPVNTGNNFGLDQPFAVYTGNLYPHKNVPVLLKAIGLLKGKINLAIVCARSIFTQKASDLVRDLGVEKQVKFLGRLSDDGLSALYHQAEVFVFPSTIEGFGLPGLEAMAARLPVIAARASCLPEIYGDACLYFDPDSPQDLADNISRILTDSGLRRELVLRGIKQVKKYSWTKMARQTWEIYQKALL